MLFKSSGKNWLFEAKTGVGTKQQFSFKNNRKQAQLTIHTQEVTGSSPVPPTMKLN
jgi:hypothetical protein